MTKSQLVFVGILALLLESCSILPWFNGADEEVELVEPVEVSESSESEAQENEIVIEPKPIAPPSTSGLIPPTNPDRQRQAIAKGRQDPFDPIAFQPIVTVEPPETPPQAEPAPPTPTVAVNPPPKPAPKPASNPTSNPAPNPAPKPAPKPASNPAQTPKPVAVEPAPVPPPMTEPLPPLAELARKVVVMGVIEVGGITQVILKAPNETSSRYVQPGQYVANGSVLVKEVEGYSELPVVVLEQDGVEVFKSVGEGTESLPEPDETAATVSLSRN